MEANANGNIHRKEGSTALISSAQNRHSDTVKYLIEGNANVNMMIVVLHLCCLLRMGTVTSSTI